MKASEDLSPLKKFNVPKIVRHTGDLKDATVLDDGTKVYRQERLYFEGHGLVLCANYDQHFCFDYKTKKIGGWTPVCTCGSPAGIVGYNAYAKDASRTTSMESTIPGELIVCLTHAQTGFHADHST